MSKAYKIKLNQGQGESKFMEIPQSGALGTPLTVKAVAGEVPIDGWLDRLRA